MARGPIVALWGYFGWPFGKFKFSIEIGPEASHFVFAFLLNMYWLEVSTGRAKCGPGRAGLGPTFLNRAEAGRAGPNNFISYAIRARSSKILKDAGRIELKNEF